MIKAFRFRKYIFILILLKFFDIMTTIYAVNYLNAREVNPLGYDVVIITSLLLLFGLFYLAKNYDKYYVLKIRLSRKSFYGFIMSLLTMDILVYIIVVSNNFIQILHLTL